MCVCVCVCVATCRWAPPPPPPPRVRVPGTFVVGSVSDSTASDESWKPTKAWTVLLPLVGSVGLIHNTLLTGLRCLTPLPRYRPCSRRSSVGSISDCRH